MLVEVISGGQTGADQAALHAARDARIRTGGWAPKGWLTEDGPATWLAKFGLQECPRGLTTAEVYRERTKENLRSCAAVLHVGARNTPGAKLLARQLDIAPRPFRWIDRPERDLKDTVKFLIQVRPRIVMVAGNRESLAPGIGEVTRRFLKSLFAELDSLDLIERNPAQRGLFDSQASERSHGDPESSRLRVRKRR